MSGTNKLEEKLSIVITTYNRSLLLKNTLECLMLSPIKNCRITVLNNHSTDDTVDIINSFKHKFTDISLVTHVVNLGGGCENYIHAIDYCDTEYMWILADDDEYDFSNFDDVVSVIQKSQVDVIQVGGSAKREWCWGRTDTPKKLYADGYNFFGYSSFLPANIFRYSYFTKYIKDAYNGIHYRYPHFPCLVSAYENDIPIYVSRKRIVTAVWGNQTYSDYIPIRGFLFASSYLSNKADQRFMMLTLPKKRSMVYLCCKYLYKFSRPQSMERTAIMYGLQNLLYLHERIALFIVKIPLLFIARLKRK